MLGGSGGSGGSNECNRVAHSRTKKNPALWRPYFWNQPRNYFPFNPNIIGHQAYWFIGKICICLAAHSAPVTMKSRAVNRSTKLKSLCIFTYPSLKCCLFNTAFRYYTRWEISWLAELLLADQKLLHFIQFTTLNPLVTLFKGDFFTMCKFIWLTSNTAALHFAKKYDVLRTKQN
jgi:hypothetical protein